MRLAEILPSFASELAGALIEVGVPALADSIGEVEVFQRCHCKEPGCLTFEAVSEADRPDLALCHRVIPPLRGVSSVLHFEGRIVWVEALGRPEERAVLDQLLPISDSHYASP